MGLFGFCMLILFILCLAWVAWMIAREINGSRFAPTMGEEFLCAFVACAIIVCWAVVPTGMQAVATESPEKFDLITSKKSETYVIEPLLDDDVYAIEGKNDFYVLGSDGTAYHCEKCNSKCVYDAGGKYYIEARKCRFVYYIGGEHAPAFPLFVLAGGTSYTIHLKSSSELKVAKTVTSLD